MTIRTPLSQSNKQNTLLVNQIGTDLDDLYGQVQGIQQIIDETIVNPATVVIPPSVNQLRNGSYSHSFASWQDTGATADTNLSCYAWYSHPVVDDQPMVIGAAATGTGTLDFTSANVNVAGDYIEFSTPHWLVTGLPITVSGTGQPAGLTAGVVYYTIVSTTTRIKFATTYADAIANTPIDLTTTGTGAAKTVDYNYTLKQALNTTYDANFSDWDWTTGTARLNGDTDVSTWFSPTTLDPSYSFFAGITAVKATQYIACDSDVRIACGIYNHEQDPLIVIVSGAGTATSNGTYTYDSISNGRSKYVLGSNYIEWDVTNYWVLYDNALGNISYYSVIDTSYPFSSSAVWQTSVFAAAPAPDVSSPATWDWVTGAFEVTGEVVGTVATPTSRDYVVHAVTDRGFSVQSSVLTVANAPGTADFSNDAVVLLSWPQVLNYGIQSYDIYRHTGATYVLLASIATGQLQYIDNNVSTAAVGYPAATFNQLTAFTATQQGTIQGLSYSGDPDFILGNEYLLA